jgi:hypothetical protein
LGFDLIVSSYFHVTEYLWEEGECIGVEIYSSKIAAWIFKEFKWDEGTVLRLKSRSVFLNGFMHIMECSLIVDMDMEEKTWRKIHKSRGAESSIHQA